MKSIIKNTLRRLLVALGLLQWTRRIRFGQIDYGEALLPDEGLVIDAPKFEEYAWQADYAVVQSFAEYQIYASQQGERHQRILKLERELASTEPVFGLRAIDPVNQLVTIFKVNSSVLGEEEHPNYRENVISPHNAFTARHRSVILAWHYLQEKFSVRVVDCYITEQLTSFYVYFSRVFPKTVGSEYLGDAYRPGEEVDGIRHESLTGLSFPDASFDLLITLDVLEHVPNYGLALDEIFRVVRPGGCILITVPFEANRQDHLIRARINDAGEIEHLLPPQYHGDPVNPEAGVLCFQTFGWAICDELRALGFSHAGVMPVWSLRYGVLGSHYVIYAVK